jgi:hypothetical protein
MDERHLTHAEKAKMSTFSISRRLFAQALVGLAVVGPVRTSAATWPSVTVHKDPNCGCCSGWVAHLELNGFSVRVIETAELNGIKTRLGVPFDLAGCHTAEVETYVIEGHVPADALKRFLTEQPKALGLSVPGMPNGSPGMSGDYEEYEVILFGQNERRVYGRFKGDKQV